MNKKRLEEFRTRVKIKDKVVENFNELVIGLDQAECDNKYLDIFSEYGIAHKYSRCDYLHFKNDVDAKRIYIVEKTRSNVKSLENSEVTKNVLFTYEPKDHAFALAYFVNEIRTSPKFTKKDRLSFDEIINRFEDTYTQVLLTDQEDINEIRLINAFDCKLKLDGTLALLLALLLD